MLEAAAMATGGTVVGTITSTNKKAHAYEDIPFLELSNGTINIFEIRWYRKAMN